MGRERWALLLLSVSLVLLQAQAWPGAAPLNGEGLALLELRARVEGDPHGVFDDWDPMDNDPCSWSGVQCSDGKVEILNLTGRELAGTLAPQIGSLQRLRLLPWTVGPKQKRMSGPSLLACFNFFCEVHLLCVFIHPIQTHCRNGVIAESFCLFRKIIPILTSRAG